MPYLLLFFLALSLAACGAGSKNQAQTPLARYGKHYLYAEDLGELGRYEQTEDSLFYLELYIQKWLEDRLIEEQAQAEIRSDENMEKLVEQYRKSLLVAAYEQKILSELVDSIISPEDVFAYYEANKEQYQAGMDWIRCYFLKIPTDLDGLDEMRGLFGQEDSEEAFLRIKDFCAKNKDKVTYILDENTWIRLDRVVAQLPKNTFSQRNLRVGATLDKKEGEYVYLFRILELRGREDAAPLQQVQQSIRNILLHQKRQQALRTWRQERFETAKKAGHFEVFSAKK